MKHKILVLLILVLFSAPLYSQEISLIVVVDALEPVPSTVKTGETLILLYRLSYLDLAEEGTQVVIREDGLNRSKLGDFDVMDFCVDKGEDSGPCVGLGGGSVQKEYLEYVWYLKYTLSIINPEKKAYAIPPLVVSWEEIRFGQEPETKSIQSVNEWDQQSEVVVNYVTTVPDGAPVYLRDSFELGSFVAVASYYRNLFWTFLVIPPILFLLTLVFFLKAPKREVIKDSVGSTELEETYAGYMSYQVLSKRQVFKSLKNNIERLAELKDDENVDFTEIRTDLVKAIMNFLRVWVPRSSSGMTPEGMKSLIEDNQESVFSKDELLTLAEKASEYQSDLEKGLLVYNWRMNPHQDAAELWSALYQFHWRVRITNYFLYVYSTAGLYLGSLLGRAGKSKQAVEDKIRYKAVDSRHKLTKKTGPSWVGRFLRSAWNVLHRCTVWVVSFLVTLSIGIWRRLVLPFSNFCFQRIGEFAKHLENKTRR